MTGSSSHGDEIRINMSKSLEKNFLSAVIYQVITVLGPVFTVYYLTRVIGSGGIGSFSYANSVTSYFVILSALGFSTYGRREIAFYQDDSKTYSKVFFEIQALKAIISTCVIVLYFLYISIFGWDKILLTILTVNIVNTVFDINWFYSGLERFGSITNRSIIVKVFYIAAIFLFVKSPDDFYIYALIEVVHTLCLSLILWPGIRKYVDRPKKLDLMKHLRPVVTLFIPTIAIQLYTVLDKSMIGFFSSQSYDENGYYELAQNLVKACLILATSMGSVMSPRVSHAISRNNMDEVKTNLYNSYRFVWLTSIPIIIVLCFIAPRLVPIYYGDGYDKVITLIRLFTPLIIIIGLSNVTGIQYFVPRNYLKYYNISLISGSVVNICLNLVLIPRYFSIGATVASVFAEGAVTLMQFVFLARTGELRIRHIFYISLKYILAGVILTFILMYLDMILPMNILGLALLIALGIMIYFFLLLLLHDNATISYMRYLKDKVGRCFSDSHKNHSRG